MSKARPKYGDAPCSEPFQVAFITQGGIAIDCEACGRTHFNQASHDFEEGELEELDAKQAKDPDAYIVSSYDIRYGYFMGRQFVLGCPCGFAGVFEDALWGNRFRISSYFTTRRLEEVMALKKTSNAVDAIAKAVQGTKD